MSGYTESKQFIAGDWGTSALRLYLCEDADGKVVIHDQILGSGVKRVAEHGRVFHDAVASWRESNATLHTLMSGMVGSTIGWHDTPYRNCPARIEDLADAIAKIPGEEPAVEIVPGLKCQNVFGMPDVMRGEEVQIFGWLAATPGAEKGRHIVCLPGTHAKWAVVEDGAVTSFFTSFQGELFEIISSHSILAGAAEAKESPAAFEKGVATMRDMAELGLMHALFSARSRVLADELAAEDAKDYLSGLIIGCDVRDAAIMLEIGGPGASPVVLIGSGALIDRYSRALSLIGAKCESMADWKASTEGLAAIRRLAVSKEAE